jgi:hypothetical protein
LWNWLEPKLEHKFRGKWLGFIALCLLFCLSSGGSVSAGVGLDSTLRFACTGFAVYAGEPIYGMNFDYPPRELRFSLVSKNKRQVFRMEFPQEGAWYSTVGMNSDGVFSSVQMLFPEWPAALAGPDQMYIWSAADYALEETASASQTLDLLSSRQVVEGETSLHTLIADPQGDAFVLEPGVEQNRITPIQGKFLLMTNFPLADFEGKDFRQTRGAGADRYQKAWTYIAETLDRFDTTQAFETLHRAQGDGDSPTLCSMVFLPNRREVFISLNRDFAKIWRVSLRDETVSTYQGFAGFGELPITEKGVLASDLATIPMQIASNPRIGRWILLGIGAGTAMGLLAWFLYRRILVGRKKKQ